MGGDTTKQETKTESSQTSPWAPVQPYLTGLLGQIGKAGATAGDLPSSTTNALSQIKANAAAAPNYGATASNLSTLLSGGGPNFSGYATDAYKSLQGQLQPYASGANVDPTTNPGFQGYLNTIAQSVGDYTNSMFAGAGRDQSPANYRSVAKGIAEAEAPFVANQYNTNVGNQLDAAKTLFTAGGGTARSLTDLSQNDLMNRMQGLNVGQSVLPLTNQGAAATIGADQTAFGLPISQLGSVESLINPIAGLGSQSQGQSQGTSTTSTPAGPSIAGGLIGGTGLLGQLGAFGSAGWLSGAGGLLPMLALSDARVKKNVKHIGWLHDGLPIVSFDYIGDNDNTNRMGVMAQDVEKVVPGAVHEIGGVKAVDYGAVAEHAKAAA